MNPARRLRSRSRFPTWTPTEGTAAGDVHDKLREFLEHGNAHEGADFVLESSLYKALCYDYEGVRAGVQYVELLLAQGKPPRSLGGFAWFAITHELEIANEPGVPDVTAARPEFLRQLERLRGGRTQPAPARSPSSPARPSPSSAETRPVVHRDVKPENVTPNVIPPRTSESRPSEDERLRVTAVAELLEELGPKVHAQLDARASDAATVQLAAKKATCPSVVFEAIRRDRAAANLVALLQAEHGPALAAHLERIRASVPRPHTAR